MRFVFLAHQMAQIFTQNHAERSISFRCKKLFSSRALVNPGFSSNFEAWQLEE
jgi:hypothetical protein